MVTSEVGIALIKKYEGCRLTAYQDSVGVWTIGYGHTRSVKQGQTISAAQADKYLRSDLATAEKAVNKHSDFYHFSQNEFDALVSFTFNCGAANLTKLTNKDLRTKAQIADKLLAYNKAGGKELKGLTRRRTEERELFLKYSGYDASIGSAECYPAYTGNLQNLDKILEAIGVPAQYRGSVSNRKKLFEAQGNDASGYTGTYQQNLFIIGLCRAGKLKKV